MKTENIRGFYQDDHHRLDALFEQFRAQKRTDFAKAAASFNEFAVGLQRHIAWEETILFPLFEERTGITQGPTAVMRMEHRQIQGKLGLISLALQEHSTETDADEEELLAVLAEHNRKEEFILYPAIDQLLSEGDRAAVFERMGFPLAAEARSGSGKV